MSIIDKILGREEKEESENEEEPDYSYEEENYEFDMYVVKFEDMSGDSWRSISCVGSECEPFVVEGNNIYLFERPELSVESFSRGPLFFEDICIDCKKYREANFSILNQEPSVRKIKTVEERVRKVIDGDDYVKYANKEIVGEEIHDRSYEIRQNIAGNIAEILDG